MKTTITITIIAAALLGCSYVQQNEQSGDETGGDAKPNQGPPEVADPPEWRCRTRLPVGEYVTSIDEGTTRDLEKCPYALSSHPSDAWPGKPNWLGIPDVVSDWLFDSNLIDGQGNLDQTGLNVLDELDLHPVYTRGDNALAWTFTNDTPEDYRSGLIGNFALWINGGVPDEGLRPPLVVASFGDVLESDIPTMIGHPFYSGRYNAYGMPCSTEPPDHLYGDRTPPITQDMPVDKLECGGFIVHDGISPAHKLYPIAPGDAAGRAIDESACLDNGGEYQPEQAAATADERNGLIWLNWDEFANVVHWVRTHLQNMPFYSALMVFLDLLESLGWEWNYWPADPDYPYARWSSTGVCGHPAALRTHPIGTLNLHTYVPCPTSMIAVFPDIVDVDEEEFLYSYYRVEGYCTFPFAFAPGPGAALTTPITEITTGAEGHGSTGFKFVAVYQLTSTQLDAWGEAIDLTPTPDGVIVAPTNTLGEDLLSALDIPPMSMVIGVDDLTLKDLGVDEPAADLTSAAFAVNADVSEGRIIRLILDTEQGDRLHRYIVPNYGPIADADEY